MTPAELEAWIERHFPGHGGLKRAAEFLMINPSTLYRKRQGSLPIEPRDVRLCQLLDEQAAA